MEGPREVTFYPVVHLLTGPPGLPRNGGIWKLVKRRLREVSDPPRLMVQALHFTSYNLSHGSWDDWMKPYYEGTRLSFEMEQTFGASRDTFVDSGGFQLMYADKIDLSKWNLGVTPEDILGLQLRYKPQRIASLDSPIPPNLAGYALRSVRALNIRNASWLAGRIGSLPDHTVPYFVMHGRTPAEVAEFGRRLHDALPPGWLKRNEFGIALGSQVPLTTRPDLVVQNICAVLQWMRENVAAETPLHIFGVGEGLVGHLPADKTAGHAISFDNSTWVQKAFRMRIYDPDATAYAPFDPARLPKCECAACDQLASWGPEFLHELMSKPAYNPSVIRGESVNRSDVLAIMSLHNLQAWQDRLSLPPVRLASQKQVKPVVAGSTTYEFPLRKFKPEGEHLVVVPCSKGRPYKNSRSHQRLLQTMGAAGYQEGEHFDRITLSGLYGPVHWKHETHEAIMQYDFPLSPIVSEEHARWLRLQTANIFSVIRKKYDAVVAYLPSKQYYHVFEPVSRAFDAAIAKELAHVPQLLDSSSASK